MNNTILNTSRLSIRMSVTSCIGALILITLFLLVRPQAHVLAAPESGINPPTADWSVRGEAYAGYYGYAVTDVGDVDGDGFGDVVIGSNRKHRTDDFVPLPQDYEFGKIYLYKGGPNGLSETPAFTYMGEATGDWLGRSVSAAGDINNDNIDDFIVTAPMADTSIGVTETATIISDTGKVYVFLGKKNDVPDAPTVLSGEAAGDQFGEDASGAGDVNGDGFDDVIVGAWQHTPSPGKHAAGKAYVYYGSAAGIGVTPAFAVSGENALDGFGISVGGAGDMNSDGYSDVVVGAWQNAEAGNEAGKIYVFYGSSAGLPQTPSFTATGDAASSEFGAAVDDAGDVNGDGYDDIVVGAYRNDDTAQDAGKAYIYYGSATGLLAQSHAIGTGERSDDRYGFSVSSAGDVNNDGFADVIVGAHQYDADGSVEDGKAYLYAGCIGGLQPTPIFSDVASNPDPNNKDNNHYGRAVSSAGDVNNDGFADILVGAYGLWGRSYAYYGNAYGSCTKVNLKLSVGVPELGDPCGQTTDLAVPEGAVVAFCYRVVNRGLAPLEWHSLDDSHFGNLINREADPLLPDEMKTFIVTATASSAINSNATWTANAAITAPDGSPTGTEAGATDTASASVTLKSPNADSDNDGVKDGLEGVCDRDGDGITAVFDPDELSCAGVDLTLGMTISGFEKTFTTDDQIKVPSGIDVDFTYSVKNIGHLVLTEHTVDGSGIGSASSTMTMDLHSDATYEFTRTVQLQYNTVVNDARWKATSPLLPNLKFKDTDTATILISTDLDDQDNDGIPDNVEKVADENNNGWPAFLDENERGDGMWTGLFLPLSARP